MIYVGIDIAKETHVAAAVDSDGVIIIEPFSFSNNHEGFKFLKSKLDSLDKNNVLVGLPQDRQGLAHIAFRDITALLQNCLFFSGQFLGCRLRGFRGGTGGGFGGTVAAAARQYREQQRKTQTETEYFFYHKKSPRLVFCSCYVLLYVLIMF